MPHVITQTFGKFCRKMLAFIIVIEAVHFIWTNVISSKMFSHVNLQTRNVILSKLCGQDVREPTTELKDLNTLRNGYIVLEYRLFYFYQSRLYDPFSFKII